MTPDAGRLSPSDPGSRIPDPGKFAFIIHPLRISDFARRYPITGKLPERIVELAFRPVPPRLLSHITGIRSATGARAEGWFIGLPLTPRTLLDSPLDFVYRRLIQCGRLAESLGAGVVGLGAFTKIVGDRGLTVASHLRIAVTTGNSYTAATAVEGALLAAQRMGMEPANVTAAVIGAVCSQILARSVGRLVLVARTREALEALQARLVPAGPAMTLGARRAEIAVETDVKAAVRTAEVILTVSSATDVLIEPEDLRPVAVVCDVARPRNVSRLVYERRDDVLVIDGGVIEIPGEVDFGFDFGFPPRTTEACVAETILLALERRYENFTLGRDITLSHVEEIAALARRHGFRLSGFRRFERAIGDDEVERIRRAARPIRVAQVSRAADPKTV